VLAADYRFVQLDEVQTPALLLNVDGLERNLAKMAKLARGGGKALRPHSKTHKSPVIAKKQIALGAGDVAFLPGHAEIGGDLGDDLTRVVAQMAAGPAEQGDQGGCGRAHRALLPRGLTFRARG